MRRRRGWVTAALALLFVPIVPSEMHGQEVRVGSLGVEFGTRKGFVFLEGMYDHHLFGSEFDAVSLRADVAFGYRSWGLADGFRYADGRARVFKVEDSGETQVQPDDGFEQWGAVGTVGAFVVIGGRFGLGGIREWAQVPKEGLKDEENEHRALSTLAVNFTQELGGGIFLSALWNATPEGKGRFRTTVLFQLR